MSVFLSPIGNGAQFFTASGLPNNGGLLYSYLAGSSTAVSTFTTSAGNVQNANPIVLGADGRPPQEIWTTNGSAYKFILQDALGNALATYDNITGINDISSAAFNEWISSSAPTYIGATSFSVLGNQTSMFPINQRTKSINTGGVIYSTVTTSSFGAGITTVTVVNDTGVVDSGLSAISYGFTNPTHPSFIGSVGSLNGSGLPASMVRLNTANGYGSTNNAIRRFTNTVTNQGIDITYADSATLGAGFTINTNGVYSISYTDQFNAWNYVGVSLNTTQPTTAIQILTNTSEILSIGLATAANYPAIAAWTGYLPAGSVVRAHTSSALSGTDVKLCGFTITRVN